MNATRRPGPSRWLAPSRSPSPSRWLAPSRSPSPSRWLAPSRSPSPSRWPASLAALALLVGCSSACPSRAGDADLFVLVRGADGPTSCPDDLVAARVDGESVDEIICGTTADDAPDCECAIRSYQAGEHVVELLVDEEVVGEATVDVEATDCGPGADRLEFDYP